ncbi:MAG: 50S ribosomal protein L25/general stress protein Ctc [Alphaproteobacteria bacterium]
MSEVGTITAEARDRAGKGAARALRRGGQIPGVIYGDKKEPVHISVNERSLNRELHKPGFFRRLYDITVNGETVRVLPREIQSHPVTDRPLHADFLRVTAASKLRLFIAVVFENEDLSPGLKRGGVLNIVRREIEVFCPATAIPETIHVDLTGLDIGDSVHFSHLSLPEGVAPAIADRDFTVASVAAPTVMEAPAEEEEEEEEAVEAEEAEEAAAEGEAEAEGKTEGS